MESSGAQSRKYLVRIRTANAEYEGMFFSPYPERRLSEVLTRMEQFINLKDAKDVATGRHLPLHGDQQDLDRDHQGRQGVDLTGRPV